jgi:hypothetical protein
MASRNTTTPNTTTKGKREYDLAHWVEAAKASDASASRQVYCLAQAVIRLCKDKEEWGDTVSEDAEYLASLAASIGRVGSKAALVADAKAGKGVREVAQSQSGTKILLGQLAAAQAEIAALRAAMASAAPTPAPKGKRPTV